MLKYYFLRMLGYKVISGQDIPGDWLVRPGCDLTMHKKGKPDKYVWISGGKWRDFYKGGV